MQRKYIINKGYLTIATKAIKSGFVTSDCLRSPPYPLRNMCVIDDNECVCHR